ncbi:RBR-type E3 ubiquitin transferase, variant 2 [Balamuthia mandrillaris]
MSNNNNNACSVSEEEDGTRLSPASSGTQVTTATTSSAKKTKKQKKRGSTDSKKKTSSDKKKDDAPASSSPTKRKGSKATKKKKSESKETSDKRDSTKKTKTRRSTKTSKHIQEDEATCKRTTTTDLNDNVASAIAAEYSEWACTACTLINQPEDKSCVICGTARGTVSKGDAAPSKKNGGGATTATTTKSAKSSSTTQKKKKKNKGKEKKANGESEEDLKEEIEEGDSDNYFDAGEDSPYEGNFLSGDELADQGDDWFLDEIEETKKEKFTVLTYSQLEKRQMDLIKATAGELGLKKWNAALILLYFKWSVSAMHAKYWDHKVKTCKKAGLWTKKKKNKRLTKEEKEEEVECLVCCDDVKNGDVKRLPCGHGPYCDVCWQNHINVIVKNSSAEGILNSKCMWPNCHVTINHGMFQKMADPEDYNRYKYFFVKHYVDCSKDLSWCSNPRCTNVILCGDSYTRPAEMVQCSCGSQFCFACGLENHNPVTCEQLSKWHDRNSDDQESIKLVMATSKPCFHCGIPTTRIDGCNHMTCRKEQGGCGGEWCWMCRGDWKTHGEHTGGYYSCNRYDVSEAKKIDSEADRLKAEADRYLHYFNRYFAHETAAKSIADMREKALEKAVEYREQTSGNVEFFMEAVDLLQRCRHTLKYTYVYGFYLPDGSKGKEFFEHLQGNAEGITEALAKQVNAPLSKLDITEFKNRIRVTQKVPSPPPLFSFS